MPYQHLNHSIAPDDAAYRAAWRRVLNRLGAYTQLIVETFRMRPLAADLLARTSSCVLVRLRLPERAVVLRLAPEHSLASLVFFGRTMARQRLPAVRLLHHDLRRELVPCDYTLESYLGGMTAADLHDEALLAAVARQTGRVLRAMHRTAVPGWGEPSSGMRWPTAAWGEVLWAWDAAHAPDYAAQRLFHESDRQAIAALIDYLAVSCPHACLLHGDSGPQMARCTVGEHVQLEGLVEPGRVVGGDGLFDLAWALLPAHPPAWCRGVLEGYQASRPLCAAEAERLRFWRAVVSYWHTCRSYLAAESWLESRDRTLLLLAEMV